MWVPLASAPGTPGWPNEAFSAVAPGAAVLLDGATTFPRGADTGCIHGAAWYARTLGTPLLAAITAEPRIPLLGAARGQQGAAKRGGGPREPREIGRAPRLTPPPLQSPMLR